MAQACAPQRPGGCWHAIPGLMNAQTQRRVGIERCRGTRACKQVPTAPVLLRRAFSALLGPPRPGCSCHPCSTSPLALPGDREPSDCGQDADTAAGSVVGCHVSGSPAHGSLRGARGQGQLRSTVQDPLPGR